jgi:cytochrome c oxidase cbb3-type subunit III
MNNNGEERIPYRLPLLLLASAFAAIVLVGSLSWAQQSKHPKSTNTGGGQQIFASACASCHGLDGRGGERAPDIAESAAVQRLSDRDLVRIVTEGVAGTGMPAFHSLGPAGVTAVVKFVRLLQGRAQPSVLPGNTARGQTLFFGQAGCGSCHMVAGQGGFLAADLSGYAKGHPVEEIRQAIVEPGRETEAHKKRALVTTLDGKQYDGVIRNEDNFSLQMQAVDGTYHFLNKTEIRNVDYATAPLMPTDYAQRLSRSELNDIVSYLMTAAKNSTAQTTSEEHD